MKSTRLRAAVCGGAALALVSCQVYTPVQLAPGRNEGPVRVTLTDGGTVRLAQLLGGGASSIEGRAADVTDTTITLRVTSLTRVSGVDETWNGEPVTISRGDAASVERKRTSLSRTMLVAGAIVGGVYLATKAGGGSTSGGGGSGKKPPGS